MSKYYTPKEEEFHIEFRYEYRREDWGEDWDTAVVKDGAQIDDIHADVWELRVKYLDREDIEELGFTYKDSIKLEGSNVSNAYRFKGKDMRGQRVELKHEPLQSWVLIYAITNTGAQTIFAGYIKNYNELKRLMDQLNITQ